MSDYNPNDLGLNRGRYGQEPGYQTESGNEQQAQSPPATERSLTETPGANPNTVPGIDTPKPPASAAPMTPATPAEPRPSPQE